ncbi:hypothetical protein [Myxosarcina sp. GI1(2024)]
MHLNPYNQVLNNFDLTVTQINDKFNQAVDKNIKQVNYNQEIQINPAFQAETSLFESNYFSALLETYSKINQPKDTNLSKAIEAFLQILIGCYGSKLTSNLNEIFTKSPPGLPLFNNFYGLFHIDFSRAGLAAVELALEMTLRKYFWIFIVN